MSAVERLQGIAAKEESTMGILVCYDDFTYDVVNDFHLADMINAGRVVGFDRSSTWVKVEYGPVPEVMVNGQKDGWVDLSL
jgi:hypothetical protein